MAETREKNSHDRVMVRAPASTSNLGPGFDVFGLALDLLYDTVEVHRSNEKGVTIEMDGFRAENIPVKPERNTAGRTALEFAKRFGKFGCRIKVNKGIPPGSGLGSSGASAAATAVALNHLLDLNLEKRELTEIAAQGEITAAGAPHADNVAPAIYGGFVIVRSYDPLEILALPPPTNLEFAIALPISIKKTTKKARSVLPKRVSLPKMTQNIGASSYIVAGVLLSDPILFGKGMLGDQVLEPARAPLYPGYLEAKKAAMQAGALAATLSGAGPTIMALVDRQNVDPKAVARVMKEAFLAKGIECLEYVSRPATGAQIVHN